jgi:cytoskeletal protein CcmA (bactofilin family)
MKNSLKFASLILLAVLVFVPLRPAAAKGLLDGQVIFGQSYTLKSGETLQGDLVVIGGSAVIEEEATVNGNIVLIGGNLNVNGEVTGEVAIIGGTVTLGARAHVAGDLTTVGATLERAQGSQVDGQINNAATSWVENGTNGIVPHTPENNPPVTEPIINFNFQPLGSLLDIFGQAIGLAVLAMLVAMFLAPQAGRVAHAVTSQPVMAGSLGLLTVIVAPIAVVLLSITVLLIPVAVIAVFALVIASVFGWIALGCEIGVRFTKAIHQEWHPALSAGLGTFALSLVTAALTGIPVVNCIGWLLPFLLGMAGLGAVIMTRFGMQAATVPASKTAVVPAGPSGQDPA